MLIIYLMYEIELIIKYHILGLLEAFLDFIDCECVEKGNILHRISLAFHFSSFIQSSVLHNDRAMSFILPRKETRKNKYPTEYKNHYISC